MAIISKTDQIVNYIRGAITSGRWAPGSRIPGEFELQSECKVSRSTVRDALILLANEGVVVRRHGLGTFVADQVIRKPGSHILIITDAWNLSSYTGYWHRQLVDEAQANISNAGYKAVLATGNGVSAEEFMSSINFSTDRDSEIVGAIDLSNRKCVQDYLTSAGIRHVRVETAVSTSNFSVVIDLTQMVETAVNVLEEYGYDDFAVMCYDLSAFDFPSQREYMRLARAAAKGREDRILTIPNKNHIVASDVFKEWWSRSDRPNAIFFMDDNLFDIASRMILELGIKIPEDLAVLTQSNVGKSTYFPTRMARVEFDPVAVMTSAWKILKSLVNSEPVIRAVVNIPPSFIEGDSLGKPITTDAGYSLNEV